jgi:hypothetical protein
MSHAFIKEAVDAHALLSGTHSDTTAAAVSLGALVVGAYESGDPNLDAAKGWANGRSYGGVYTGNDVGPCKYWQDGLAGGDVAGGTAALTAVTWKKLVAGAPGEVLTSTAAGVDWATVAAVGVGLAARVYRSTDQAFAGGGADDTVNFSTVDWDDGVYWTAAAPSKLTVPASGVYSVVGQIAHPLASFGLAHQRIFVNGAVRAEEMGGLNNVSSASLSYDCHQVCAILKLAANDYVELHCRSWRLAGALDGCKGGITNTWLSIVRVG